MCNEAEIELVSCKIKLFIYLRVRLKPFVNSIYVYIIYLNKVYIIHIFMIFFINNILYE